MKTDKKQARWRRLLRKAANLLKKNGWCKGAMARNKDNAFTSLFDKSACSFCLVGSIYKANNSYNWGGPMEQAMLAAETLAKDSLSAFNDTTCKSKEQAINFLLKVANS